MAEILAKISDELAQVAETASPAVVRVEGRRRLPSSGIAWTSDGVIVTANHTLERDDDITIGLPDGSTAAATLVGRDPTTDVAVLRVKEGSLTPPVWAPKDSVRVGHLSLAIGRPGDSILATLGIVSALGKSWRTRAGGRVDSYVQTDLVMYPGFSGGPLVDVDGRVIGLSTSALVRGVSLAVPTATLERVVKALLSDGHIRHGYLGVGAQPVRLPEALATQVGQEAGLLLTSVEAGSPAEKAGLMLGDTLVSVDGQPTLAIDDLQALLSGDHVGATLPIKIVRGGATQEISVVVGERS